VVGLLFCNYVGHPLLSLVYFVWLVISWIDSAHVVIYYGYSCNVSLCICSFMPPPFGVEYMDFFCLLMTNVLNVILPWCIVQLLSFIAQELISSLHRGLHHLQMFAWAWNFECNKPAIGSRTTHSYWVNVFMRTSVVSLPCVCRL
jgi:hypothetical protein